MLALDFSHFDIIAEDSTAAQFPGFPVIVYFADNAVLLPSRTHISAGTDVDDDDIGKQDLNSPHLLTSIVATL